MNHYEITIDLIEQKLNSMNTDLNKLAYIENSLKDPGFSYEIKRFLLERAAELYEQRKMYDKGAKALSNKASMEILFKDRTESYLKAAELYCLSGNIDEAESIFIRSAREVNEEEKKKIKLARKNIYLKYATDLEKTGKKRNALKFFEKLLKIKLDPVEAELIKRKTIEIYKSLGMFREAKLLENK